MRAGIYIRVSTEEQTDGYSLAAQERACRQYAERHGWTVVSVYADEGISGRRENRPALQGALADIDARHIDALVVHKLDRLARNLRLTLEIIERLRTRTAAFASVGEQLDLSTPIGWAMFQVQGVFAEFYSRNLATETKKGLQEKARQGRWVGPVPLGYERGAHGVLVPSADAEAVRVLFAEYATGLHSDTTIADLLNARGYRALQWKTGVRPLFGREAVRTILKNRAYIGEVSAGGVAYPGAHAPLVDTATFDRVQQLRASRTRKDTPNPGRPGGLLTGVVACAVCGKRMWYHRSGRGAQHYYLCSGRDHRTCTAPMVPADATDAAAIDVLHDLTIPNEWHAEIIAAAEAILHHDQTVPTVDRADIEAQLRRLGTVYADGLINDLDYRRQRDALCMQLAQVVPAHVPDVAAAAQVLHNLPSLVATATLEQRRALIATIFSTFWLEKPMGIKAITPTGLYLPLVGVIMLGADGVADGTLFPHPHITRRPVALHHPRPLHGVGRAQAA